MLFPPGESRIKSTFRLLVAMAMTGVGIAHFTHPEPFVRIVPDWLPSPLLLVLVSGFFEIAGGVGLLVRPVQRWAAWGLVALYVAVFPANIHMAVHQIQLGVSDNPIPVWVMWARLPFQLIFIATAVWLARDPGDGAARAHGAPRA